MNIKDVISRLEDKMYSKNEVKHLLNSITELNSKVYLKEINVGDMFVDYEGKKKRPFVVLKSKEEYDTYVSIPLTTSTDFKGIKYSCRINGEGYFCNYFKVHTAEFIKNNFSGVFTDFEGLKMIEKHLKELI